MGSDINPQSSRRYQGHADCLTKIVKHDGLTGLYRGFGITLAETAVRIMFLLGPAASVLLTSLVGRNSDPNLGLLAISGFGGAILQEVVAYPMDTVRKVFIKQALRNPEDVKLDGRFQNY